MEPMLKEGDIVLASFVPYLFHKPNIGDIIVFKIKDKFFIKRIKEIKDNKYIVKGDNKKDSLDSKQFGSIVQNQIIAEVIYKI
ncbi:MAG: hypothetical protein A3B38_03945 [Candidatus Levybacteria bacterium RIFCSPLOWO2_01_FULL_36_13]|nr:MAG: hypothetical protein A2684_00880 [Candidatus Levybacteria bacterium RIFCSPHIGHO2_01_FULL_36_15b]OGH34282.1 MAG: hypothetical protein A3B38_03945 [Candidatus Levybacteria bacterium RIFCSPLOWO2_01_FULL_36_13]